MQLVITLRIHSPLREALQRYEHLVFAPTTRLPFQLRRVQRNRLRKPISLLRSPHANKNSQEHFILQQITRQYVLKQKVLQNATPGSKTFLTTAFSALTNAPELSGNASGKIPLVFETKF